MIAQLVKVVRSLFRTELEISPLEAQAAEIIAGKPWLVRPSLSQLAQMEKQAFPLLIRESAAAQKYLDLLGPLDWEQFPDRDGGKKRRGPKPAADAPLVAAFLVKMDKGLDSMAKLRQELIEQPALTWVLGFPLVASEQYSWGFDVAASLPTHRHMSRLLRKLPNEQMQFLLKSSVQLFQRELPADLLFGDTISGDTKHIIAWVRENNPKEHIRGGRFHKEKQPKGDADCKVSFKANENQAPHSSKPSDGTAQASAAALPPATESTATPTTEGLPASGNLPKPKDGFKFYQ